MRLKLSRTRKAWLYSTVAVLWLSGVLWLLSEYRMSSATELDENTSSSAPLWLKLHGAAAMIFLIVFGTLLRDHVRAGWRVRRNWVSGGGLVFFGGILTAQGYALYYFGDERLRPSISLVHWAAGVIWPAVIAYHIWAGHRARHRLEK